MFTRKVMHHRARSKPGQPDKVVLAGVAYDHYVAIDWSLKIMAIAHMSRHAAQPRVFERPSDVRELKNYLGSLHARTIITFEESGAAHWLYLELLDVVERIVICDPFQNRLLFYGPKTDTIDAGKLCELLRAGLLKEVYHSDSALYELRLLVSAYDDVVRSGIRVLNQNEAFRLAHRDNGKAAAFIGGILKDNIDLYRRSKEEYERCFRDIARRTTQNRYPLTVQFGRCELPQQRSLTSDLLADELIFFDQSLEAFLHPPIVESKPSQVLDVGHCPFAPRFWQLDAVEPQFRFDPILHPHAVANQLPPPSDDLPMVSFFLRRYPRSFQQSLRQKIRELPAVTAVGLHMVAILLWYQARRCYHALCSISDKSIMEPESEVACLVHHSDSVAGILL